MGTGDSPTPRDPWPLHTPDRREYLELNTRHLGSTDRWGAIGVGPRVKECAFWGEYLPEQGPDALGDSKLLALASRIANPYYIGFGTAEAH